MSDWQHQWEIVDANEKPLSGGQGSVIKVRHKSDGRVGALKRLHDEHQRSTERRFRMQQEVNALLALAGKGTPKILDANADHWQDETVPLWAVMEWIPGKTLQQHVKSSLMLDEAIRITEQLLATVDECHKLGIHHRDLKHDNVILRDGDLQPVLVDFGMSWTRPDEGEDRDFRTRMDQEIGNRFLRLPEHVANRHVHHNASDLSMVVGLLFFMLTGTAPRVLQDSSGKMPHEASEERFGSVVLDVRWPRLRRLFGIAFQAVIEQRFQNAEEIQTRLRDLVPVADSGDETAWREELAGIEDLRNSERGRMLEATKTILLTASQRFLSKLQASVQGTGFVSGGGGPNLVEGNRAAELTFFIVPQGGSNPQVSYAHRVELNAGQVTAIVTVEGEPADPYYTGLATDPEALYEAADRKVSPVLASLLRKMRGKLAGYYAA